MNTQKLWTKDFAGIALINVLLFLGWQMQLATLPIYLKQLSGTDSIVGLCTFAGTVTALLARPLAGYMADRYGRRGIFFAGIIVMIAATLLYSWFPLASAVIAVRFLHGLGWGTSTTSSNTIASDVIPHSRFGEGMGYFSLSQSVSLAFAPVIGLALMDSIGYRNMTFAAAGMLAVAFIMAFFLRYRRMEPSPGKFSPYEKAAFRPASVMVFVGMAVGSVFGFAALYGDELGFGNAALFFTVYAFSLLITRPLIGRLIDRRGYNIAVYPGFVILAVSFAMLFLSDNMVMFLAAAFVQGVSYGAVQTSLQTMAVADVPPRRRGAANATFFTGFDAGIGLGNLFAGLIASALDYSRMYLLMIIPLAVGGVLYYAVARNHRPIAAADSQGSSDSQLKTDELIEG